MSSGRPGRAGRHGDPPSLPGLDFVAPLGSGGYSDVFLYEQQMPRMKVAVKVLMTQHLSEQARRQFGAEANAMAQLADHPYIVQVFRADIAPDGRPYIVMKYYPQPNLAMRARAERFGVADVLRIGIQVASAVEAAHRIGLLHRDIKPANVLTGQYGTLGLTDFGIAATKAEAAAGQTDGVSIPWAAPEVLYSAERADERSDVYSIAATLWHLLAGRSPFDVRGGDNSALALMARITSTPPPPTGRGDVPPSLERLLQTAMAKDAAARPPSALALARGLQEIEREQRLALTRIVVADDHGNVAPAGADARSGDPDADGTRIKQAVRVDGADGPARAPQAHLDDDEATRRKQPTQIPAAQPGAGSLPPWAPPGRPAAQPPAPSPPKPRRNLTVGYLVGGGVVAAFAAVIAVVLVTRGSSTPHPAPTLTDTGGTQVAVPTQAAAPGIPTVTAKRAGSRIRFTWTYQHKVRGDSFQWRQVGSGGNHAATTAQASLPYHAGTPVCLQVRVLRLDGSSASGWSRPACAG